MKSYNRVVKALFSLEHIFEIVFRAEGGLNLISGLLLTFMPAFCMEAQGLDSTNELANANLRQFGTLVFLLGILGALNKPIAEVIFALWVGDILWCYVFHTYVMTPFSVGVWSFGANFSFWITVFLCFVRTLYLCAGAGLIEKEGGAKKKGRKFIPKNN
jgi:hypothetical protein